MGVYSLLLLYSYAVTVYGFQCSEFSYNCNAMENHFLEINCNEKGCACSPDRPDLDICKSNNETLSKDDCESYCNAECKYYKYIEVLFCEINLKPILKRPMFRFTPGRSSAIWWTTLSAQTTRITAARSPTVCHEEWSVSIRRRRCSLARQALST